MSGLLDKFSYFTNRTAEPFADKHGSVVSENRDWEDGYRRRWQHDKIVRSTHGVNCTGSCSWKIYVKQGIITWETQYTDYPRTRPDLPNHEPRGCQRGASYSWYIYSANRLKYPLIRDSLIRLWRVARKQFKDPVDAWGSIASDPKKMKEYQSQRGLGGYVRLNWDEVNEIIASANIYTAKTYGPDRVTGFSPIPAMSMVSYAAGTRYLSLIGGTCLSFYDWYCDLPPSSPQTWGEQTDVPESADWYNSSFLMIWGANLPQTRTPDAHFVSEARYSGTKTVVVTPDFSEISRFADIWLHPKAGTDAAMAMAMGHVILKKFFVDKQTKYFNDYCRRFSDMPFLVRLKKQGMYYVPEAFIRASDFKDDLGEKNNAKWKPVVIDEKTSKVVVPNGTIGSRWGEKGKWNLEEKDLKTDTDILPKLSFIEGENEVVSVAFPYYANDDHAHEQYTHTQHKNILTRNVPAHYLALEEGDTLITTVFDLFIANYGVDRGLGGDEIAQSFDDDVPYTPAWQEAVTGVKREEVIAVATQFAENAEKTEGRSMVILGAAMNHWYHSDMSYRTIINMLVMCGCVGKSGGGWAHYVGQEKLRPQTGWTPLAFALDWQKPPRHMNGTSFFYTHTDQWRYEKVAMTEVLSPLAENKEAWGKLSFIDCNAKAERLGWLPSAPQLEDNPLYLNAQADKAGIDVKDYVIGQLKSGDLKMSCEDPDNPKNYPRNLFVWRSNILGSSGKGHEYFLKHLLGTKNGVQGGDLDDVNGQKPSDIIWHDKAPEGKLDLLTTLDFRMSTTAMHSDIVLPSASWYEKNDLNTSDMHPFIHPFSQAIDPVWESRNDWEIYKGIAKTFSELCPNHLGVEKDVVLTPLQHDTANELGQSPNVLDWKKDECEPIPGETMPQITIIERDYPNTYAKYTAIGPLLEKSGNGGKGIAWNTQTEVDELRDLNRIVTDKESIAHGQPCLNADIDATEMILSLAPETNGEVAVKAWDALSEFTGRDHSHLAGGRKDEKIRYRDVQAQPRKIISSPTWSGIESEEVSYTASYTNVHELIPWRTLTGRQELYQDHLWMRAFGETLAIYKPPVDTKNILPIINKKGEGKKQLVLCFNTPHQKWGIHSTYSENLIMQTLSRGGPIVWVSEIDATKIDLVDNDWIEIYNVNGALTARVVVSQRIPEGVCIMYHAQEKLVNIPLAETTQNRGGINNSLTRVCIKPTHMIGGYAQLSYGFNYYGTVGCNRDEVVILRKLENVEWGVGEQA